MSYMSIALNRFCTKAKYPRYGVQSAFYDGFCRIAVRGDAEIKGCTNKASAENIIIRTNNYSRKILEGKTPLTAKEYTIIKAIYKECDRGKPEDFIFSTSDGKMRSYYGTNTMFKRFLKKHGGDAGIHFYRYGRRPSCRGRSSNRRLNPQKNLPEAETSFYKTSPA